MPVFTRTFEVAQSNIFLGGEILGPECYSVEFNTLLSAEDHDSIHMHINSNGGRLDTTLQFMDYMNNCRGFILTVAQGAIQSAGGILFLSGHDFYVGDGCSMMIHAASLGDYGKMHEMSVSVPARIEQAKETFERVYSGFLTPKELDSVLKGSDMYLKATQIRERLEKLKKHRAKK